jgi:RNA polymerase sigma-70 factor (ECF subfamily)
MDPKLLQRLRMSKIRDLLIADDQLMTANCTEEILVIRTQNGDSTAFTELMRRTSSCSLKLAQSILQDRDGAEDEVQNAYLKAWLNVGNFQRESKFSTWLSRIVINQCLMRLRQLRGKTFVYLDQAKDDEWAGSVQTEIADANPTPELAFQLDEYSDQLWHEVRQLPPLLRRVLIQRDLNERPTADVANSLGISQVAVKSRLLRARHEIRKRWMKREAIARKATASSTKSRVA